MKLQVFNRLIPLVRQRWRIFLLATIAATVAQVVGIPLALLTRRMVNLVGRETSSHLEVSEIERSIWMLGAVLVGLTFLRGISRWVRGVSGEIFAQGTIASIRKDMIVHIHSLSMGYFDKRATGKIVIRFVGDAQGLRGWLATKLVSLPSDILTVIGVLVAVGFIHIQLFYALIIPPLALLPVLLIINPRARKWTRQARSEQSRLTGDLTDRLAMMPALKGANAQRSSIEPLVARIDSIANSFVRRSYLDSWGQAVAMTVGSLSLCAIGIWGSILILHNQATSGDIVGAIWLSVLIRSPITRLTSTNIAYHRVRVAFDRIDALLLRKPEPGWTEGLEEYTGSEMKLRLKDVGYRDRQDRWLIRGLTKTLIGPGCVVVRGDSAATNAFFELIMRVRRPHEGRIRFDGVDARKLRVADIRSHIGWVDAQRMMISATLFEREVEEIDKQLDQTEMITKKRPSIDKLHQIKAFEHNAHVASGGEELSLALACAMLNDPPIILIDQPELGLSRKEIDGLSQWIQHESKHRLIVIASNKRWAKEVATKIIRLESEKAGYLKV